MRAPSQQESKEGILGVYESVGPCLNCGKDSNLCFEVRNTGVKSRFCSMRCANKMALMPASRYYLNR